MVPIREYKLFCVNGLHTIKLQAIRGEAGVISSLLRWGDSFVRKRKSKIVSVK